MNFIGTIVIGFLAGVVAKFLAGGRELSGCLVTTVLGIVGAIVATWLGQFIGWYRPGETAGFVGAVVGAVVVLAVHHALAGRRRD